MKNMISDQKLKKSKNLNENMADPISYQARTIIDNLKREKERLVNIAGIINLLSDHINGAINISNPLRVAKNLHVGNYVGAVNSSQLWTLKRFYDITNYASGLIDVGNKFFSQKNYHGAYESFHSANYAQGLIEMTKSIVKEVESGNKDNIGYAKKALVDIVRIEGNKNVKQYINTIAESYMKEYKSSLNNHIKNDAFLHEAKELYSLNKDLFKVAKISAKIAYHNFAHKHSSEYHSLPSEDSFKI